LAERRLVIATGNAGKQGEYRELLAGAGWHLMAVDPGVAEVGETYAAVSYTHLTLPTICSV